MKLKEYIKETTEPSVDMATESLKFVFKNIRKMLTKYEAFDIDDSIALSMLKQGFDIVGVKIEMGKKKSSRKYIYEAEFGGNYGDNYAWKIKMIPGFSKVFKKFATPKGWRNLENPNKNSLMREFIDVLSHEILHTKQALGSGGAAFDPEIQGIESTYTGDIKQYLKNPIEIEPHAQQAAIDTIRIGEKNSPVIKNYKYLFPSGSKVLKKFLKKYYFYLRILKAQGQLETLK